MPVPLWHKAYIAGPKFLGPRPSMGAKYRHPRVAPHIILPFVGVRMPVQLSEPARFEVHLHRSQRGLNWKLLRRHDSLRATLKHSGRRLVQAILMRRLAWLQIDVSQLLYWHGWDGARTYVKLFLRKLCQRRRRNVEHAACNGGIGVGNPIRNTKRAELGEVSAVESQQEVALARPEALQSVTMATREIPRVARNEFRDLRLPVRRNHGRAAAALDDVSPFRRQRVPVQLADRARL